ncbi:unnamed protein product [Didymodactylos carnosus]|uniref:Uncharacterized protein n=1 Tax=Didymodactylos carnosus TaxID=1234261 RepID=A0A815RRC7_9BILA|nr:unnamed protein product [Didymodactylos carnosus]CAF1480772.1 unnamed protein product [Didymodactylos carnosus]CAF4173955.1 unnamed protein product [Didymodactylos carnosus]CAF4345885.1 unnamed protein product [Didymodactylos carnosus]
MSNKIGEIVEMNENYADQLILIDSITSYIHLGIDELNVRNCSSPLIIADFGSSYEFYSIHIMKTIIEYLRQTNKLVRPPLIVHNDLPINDWTRLFELLARDNSYEGVANGRSFYEQCLPPNCLSIGFSSASLHLLSQKPCNFSNHCYYTFAEESERQRFKDQSKLDFISFLEHRSRELVSGGVLILIIPSAEKQETMSFNYYFDLLYKCAQSITFLTPQDLLNYTIPLHLRSLSECVDFELFERCSFKLIKAEFSYMKYPIFVRYQNGHITLDQFAKTLTVIMRTTTELSFKQALEITGRSKEDIDKILTQFWTLYEETVRNEPFHDDVNTYIVCLILKKVDKVLK